MYSLQDSTILVSCNNHLKTGSQGLIQTGISLANGIGSNIQTFPHYTVHTSFLYTYACW